MRIFPDNDDDGGTLKIFLFPDNDGIMTADSISRKDQQHNNITAEKGRDNKRNKDRLKVSMKHFQSAIEKVNRKSKTSSAT